MLKKSLIEISHEYRTPLSSSMMIIENLLSFATLSSLVVENLKIVF